uniref:Uncharacterized protein n=1 Tax=Vibrio tasmaniensis TaxID=212663 RepID=A0A0H3ZKK7_9VIBR|nr:hypothetical protein [Vibrio tasmaniensis]
MVQVRNHSDSLPEQSESIGWLKTSFIGFLMLYSEKMN